jgi:UDP-N-acetylmuramoyl-tripeptide--D-alanyl-D-alanine ligase
MRPGELFVALRGERFDGHEFVGGAARGRRRRGGRARCARAAPVGASMPCSWSTTRGGARALGAHWRARFALPLIGSPAATARPRSRRCSPRSCARTTAAPRGARHRGQPQQRHRRAADAAQAARRASLRGDRDGHEPPGRDRYLTGLARPTWRWSTTPAARAHRHSRFASRRSREPRARSTRAWAPTASR